MKKRVVVVCPGRGSYTADTLGYLKKMKVDEFISDIDARRSQVGDPTISDLDGAEKFKMSLHTKGEHASVLIYACAYADFMQIDREKYEIVAVTGNSMGWYLALAMAGSLDWAAAFSVIQTMGGQMRRGTIGGQVIYPVVDADWKIDPQRVSYVDRVIADIGARPGHELHNSIFLGGYRVIGGNKEGLQALLSELEPVDRYPFQLVNHGAFHTPLLGEVSARAFEQLPYELFRAPEIPVVDGRGVIWPPYATDVAKLRNYTLDHQVVCPYDFSASIRVALREFAPDHLVLLGPGNSLGGVLGQTLIENNWLDIDSKQTFQSRQSEDPLVISMGLDEQRGLVTC